MGMGWLVRGCGELLLPVAQFFKGMEQHRYIAVLREVAAVGQVGLQINESGNSRNLRTCQAPGATWSWPS